MLRTMLGMCSLILILSLGEAEELPLAETSLTPQIGWERNILNGESLAREIRPGRELSGYRIQILGGQMPETTPGLHGAWNYAQPLPIEKYALPGTSGFVESDLLGKQLYVKYKNGWGSTMRHLPDGRLYLTIHDDRGVPGGAILYWKIHGGFLYYSHNEDISNPTKHLLIKREGKKLLVEIEGREDTWEYLPSGK